MVASKDQIVGLLTGLVKTITKRCCRTAFPRALQSSRKARRYDYSTRIATLIHNCSSCSLAEIGFEEDGSGVYLNLNKVATEEDLESDHHLEDEGQTIETIKIQVAFCPYCGQNLTTANKVVVPQFQYHNFAGRK